MLTALRIYPRWAWRGSYSAPNHHAESPLGPLARLQYSCTEYLDSISHPIFLYKRIILIMVSPPIPAPTGDTSSHRGNCHCGAVRFSLTVSPPLSEYPVVNCTCSICSKNGYLLIYPNWKDFKLESGEEVLKDHLFATRQARHRFCGQCGSSVFIHIPGAPFLALNVSAYTEDRISLGGTN